MVHGQAVVHAVNRLYVHHAREPMAPLHDARMAHLRGLGHPGCPGCVDKKREVFDGHGAAFAGPERLTGVAFNSEIDARKRRVCVPVRPDRRRHPQLWENLRHRIAEFSSRNYVLREYDANAMRERGAHQVRVEQGNNHAHAGNAQP